MANQTADRRATVFTTSAMSQPQSGPYSVTPSGIVYKGLMYTVDSSGILTAPGATTAAVLGVCNEHIDLVANPTGTSKTGLFTGVFAFDNHGTHAVTWADIAAGNPVYASDNHTLSNLASDGSPAGIPIAISGTQVLAWISPVAVKFAHAISTVALGGALTGTTTGTVVDVAATAAATPGGATPTAANVDTGIATALAPLVTSTRLAIKELWAAHNALVNDLKS